MSVGIIDLPVQKIVSGGTPQPIYGTTAFLVYSAELYMESSNVSAIVIGGSGSTLARKIPVQANGYHLLKAIDPLNLFDLNKCWIDGTTNDLMRVICQVRLP